MYGSDCSIVFLSTGTTEKYFQENGNQEIDRTVIVEFRDVFIWPAWVSNENKPHSLNLDFYRPFCPKIGYIMQTSLYLYQDVYWHKIHTL